MANVIVSDFDQREVFGSAEKAEAAMLAAIETLSDGGTLTFGWRPEFKGSRFFLVTARRRGSRELVGYLGPAGEP